MTVYKTTLRRFILGIATGFLVALQVAPASAQLGMVPLLQEDPFCKDYCEHDLQFFAPVDFDYDCLPLTKKCGWFFGYDKLSWVITGERTAIGDQSLNVQSEVFLPDTPDSLGTAPPTYRVINSVQDAPPASEFGWGERYEFGYRARGHAWEVGILDGPEVNTYEVYGFDEITIPGTLPLTSRTRNDNNPDTIFDFDDIDPNLAATLFPNGPNDISTSLNGFGSVAVNFRAPPGFLSGLRDYWVDGGPVTAGPGRRLEGVTVTTNLVNGVLVQNQVTTGTLVTGDDGIEDDINGNGLTFFFIDLDGDGVRDPGEPAGIDFGDLHNFNVFFDTLIVRNTTRTDGVELMNTIVLANRHKLEKHRNSHFKVGAGVRYFQLEDQFVMEGQGSVLGSTVIKTDVQNSIFGPQVRLQWNRQRGRFGMGIDGRFMWGFNVQDLDLDANIGQDLVPGGINSSAIGRPTATRSGKHEETFSPFVEFRADATYELTSAISARVGYTAMFLDNITRGARVVDYVLPNPGLLKGGQQDIFINGVNFGFDVVY